MFIRFITSFLTVVLLGGILIGLSITPASAADDSSDDSISKQRAERRIDNISRSFENCPNRAESPEESKNSLKEARKYFDQGNYDEANRKLDSLTRGYRQNQGNRDVKRLRMRDGSNFGGGYNRPVDGTGKQQRSGDRNQVRMNRSNAQGGQKGFLQNNGYNNRNHSGQKSQSGNNGSQKKFRNKSGSGGGSGYHGSRGNSGNGSGHYGNRNGNKGNGQNGNRHNGNGNRKGGNGHKGGRGGCRR